MLDYYAAQAILSFYLAVYFLPLMIAAVRDVRALGQVAVVNTLLGWTGIGWVVALAMAYREKKLTY